MTTAARKHRRLKTAHSLAIPCLLPSTYIPATISRAAQSPTLNLFFLAGIAGAALFHVYCVAH